MFRRSDTVPLSALRGRPLINDTPFSIALIVIATVHSSPPLLSFRPHIPGSYSLYYDITYLYNTVQKKGNTQRATKERPMDYEPLHPNPMYDAPSRAQAAIEKMSSHPFPKLLRQALGRSLVEQSYYEFEGHGSGFNEFFQDPPMVPVAGNGTPGPAQLRKALRAPQPIKTGILIQLEPTGFWDVLMEVLEIPAAIQALSENLVEAVKERGLLAGFSALAFAGGCLYFASYALQIPIGYTSSDLQEAGLSFHGTRCAYNELWRRRDELADVLEKHGGLLAMLRLPIASDGSVYRRTVQVDAKWRRAREKEEKLEKVHGSGRRAALKKLWLAVQERMSSTGKRLARFLPDREQTMCVVRERCQSTR